MNWKALLYALESRKNSKFLIPRALKGGRFFFFFFFLRKNKFKQGLRGGAVVECGPLACGVAVLAGFLTMPF